MFVYARESLYILIRKEEFMTIPLFYPYIPPQVEGELLDTLHSKWIGQGPKVDAFEEAFQEKFIDTGYQCIAVGSGTDALHLAYILAGIKEGDEVVTPVLTCTATNIPLLYLGANIKFVDIQKNTLNIDPDHLRKLVTKKTKAIVCMHYGGLPCNMEAIHEIAEEYEIPVIEDAAQALGAKYNGKYIGNLSDFTIFSFQAIKHITTGDGGMLVIKNKEYADLAKRLRWFGINRKAKFNRNWENDIKEIGYKYQMTDIGASIGLASLKTFDSMMENRKELYRIYQCHLADIEEVQIMDDFDEAKDHAMWSFVIATRKRKELENYLRLQGIESGQNHYRNDKYSIFHSFQSCLKNMDLREDQYLSLPIHPRVTAEDAIFICDKIHDFFKQ